MRFLFVKTFLAWPRSSGHDVLTHGMMRALQDLGHETGLLTRDPLIIATASSVAPGFKGCITLELVNNGEVPIVLRPGMRIAQLVFFETAKDADYRQPDANDQVNIKYDCPTGPEFSRIHRDTETAFWC